MNTKEDENETNVDETTTTDKMKRTYMYFYVKKTECVSILVRTICKFQRKKSESRPSFQLCIKTIMSQFFQMKVDVYCLAIFLTFLP